MLNKILWSLAVGVPLLAAIGWAVLTPAGIIGSLVGVCIIGGLTIVMIGIGSAGGLDTAAERLLPGAKPKRPSKRLRTVGVGLAYVAAGAFLYWLK